MKETITKLYLELSLIVPKGTKTLRDIKNEEQIAALRADWLKRLPLWRDHLSAPDEMVLDVFLALMAKKESA